MKEFKIRCSAIGQIMSNARAKGELSTGTITYLKNWYAEQKYNDREQIFSKYLSKGNQQENEAIEVVVDRFNLGLGFKNPTSFENEYMTGTPDLLSIDTVFDTKCSWNGKTFLDSITSTIDKDYEWQLIGYMALTDKKKASLCYVLLNTPEEANFGNEIIYDEIDINQRFFSFDFELDESKLLEIEAKVIKCREWLNDYDLLVKGLLND